MTERRRFVCARKLSLLWLLLLPACAGHVPLPVVTVPALAERSDPVSELPPSTLSVALGLDLRLLEPMLTEVLNTQLQLRQDDWQRVTERQANPQVETRMQARVEKLTLAVKGDALRVQARVAYWGKARAQLDTPFGKAWLSHGTDWGTEKRPGAVLLTLDLKPSLSRTFALATQTRLVDVGFEAPPGEALCGRIVVKVCVPREQAAVQVHAALDKAVRGAAPGLLAELDRRLSREVDPASALSLGVRALEHASPSIDGAWLRVAVERVAVGPLSGKGPKARLPLELRFRPLFGPEAPAVPRAVLERDEPSGHTNEFAFDMGLPFESLSRAFSAALQGVGDGGLRVKSATVLGASQASSRLLIALTLTREREELTIYAEVDPALVGARLRLANARFTDSSRAALAQAQVRESVLAAALAERCSIALPPVSTVHLDALRLKLQTPLLLFGTLSLSLSDSVRFSDLRYTARGLAVRVQGPGQAALR